ncbi:YadA C-terminal domain-containing protein [Proteus mirabilis]|uniref:YadA C-terminal domain-containing protein n=1 Tax=Proteus mirabilis TaxID=584 RepID=UPI000A8DD35F|nr:YadA-like family protein [Proteus mirabilis]MDC9755368.1 YadA-like family protein [Proteus mirabilis]MDZ7490774.1 YadA-like family protein [Proteus mirabilis]
MSNFKYYFFLITFTSEFIYAGGSLQLCNKHIDTYGSSIGSESYKKDLTHYSSVTKIICNTNDDARFSLNSEGDGLGQYGYDASKAQIKGMASGKITIRSTETTFTGYSKFQNNISLDNNKIFNIKDGTLSENSKEAVNGSQLFKIDSVKADKVSLNNTDKNVSENADSINKLDENLKKTNQQIEINTTSINKHNMELKEYNSAIKDIDFKTRDLTNTADILSKIAIKTQQDMNENTQSISRLNQDKADKAQLAETDKRVDANTHNIATYQNSIDNNTQAIDWLDKNKVDKAQLIETTNLVRENTAEINSNREAIDDIKSSNILQENLINHRTDNLINLEKISRDEGDKRVLTSSKSYTDSRFSSAISYADDKFGQLDNKINQTEKKLNAGIAGVTAISSIPYVSENTFSYGMGVGNYQNGNAIAAGVQLKTIYNSNIRVNISWDSSSNTALGVGISGGW